MSTSHALNILRAIIIAIAGAAIINVLRAEWSLIITKLLAHS